MARTFSPSQGSANPGGAAPVNITNRLRRLTAGTGLLDEDREGFQAAGLRDYRRVQQLVLLEHANAATKRLVLICPRLEEWLYERAAACGVAPGDYGLPDTAERLKANPRYEQKPKFPEFLQRLREVDSEVQCRGRWIAP